MHFAAFALGCVLIGQAPNTAAGDAPAAASRQRISPPAVVAQWLTLPPGSAVSGRPLALATILASTTDRRQQIELVHAYWRLAEAMADYHCAWIQSGQLARLQVSADEAAELRVAQLSATAALQEAEAELVAAQHQLAGPMPSVGDAPLPLPGDQPHVGAYRTYFKELFAVQPAPQRARLLDGTLPLRCRAIVARAEALQAAEEALAAAGEARASRHGPLAPLLTAWDALRQQQRAMMASVCRYNHDIADYALGVAEAETSADALAAMLVRSTRQPVQQPLPVEAGGVRPASAVEPVPDNDPRRTINQPTLAPPRNLPPAGGGEPTLAPPPGARSEPTLAPPGNLPPAKDGSEPRSLLRQPAAPADPKDWQPR
jgi:hypothetical protein